MFGFILLGLLGISEAQTPLDSIVVSIDPDSDKITSIIATCGLKRKKEASSNGRVVLQDLAGDSCNLKFNPSGGSFRNVQVGTALECKVSNGMNVRCLSMEEVAKREAAVQKKKSVENKKAIVAQKAAVDVPADQLIVELLPTSEKVLSVNIICDDYRKKGIVTDNRVHFSAIPAETCNLKFNPGGGSMRGIETGTLLRCSVSQGNRVSCN